MQVIRHRNDKEQDNQRTSHCHDFLPVALPLRGARKKDDLDQNPNNRHAYPNEIERQFHVNLIIVCGSKSACNRQLLM